MSDVVLPGGSKVPDPDLYVAIDFGKTLDAEAHLFTEKNDEMARELAGKDGYPAAWAMLG
jgi:hypothetical protein